MASGLYSELFTLVISLINRLVSSRRSSRLSLSPFVARLLPMGQGRDGTVLMACLCSSGHSSPVSTLSAPC